MKMIHLIDGLSLRSQLTEFSALAVHYAVAFLLMTHSCIGQSGMISLSQPIVATVGDDIILPCRLEPAMDVVSRAVEWARLDLNPRFVHVRRDGVELLIDQNPSYLGRTSIPVDKLKCGDVSLKLSKLKLSDNGTYRCYIPELKKGFTVQLIVGVFSSPSISIARDSGAAVMLDCKSAGWYPEPEVLWLDGEGKLLSAGPTETVRGPDDLYTVSSRVTVEKRHSNSFTCRVQQRNISLTRYTHIHVADNVLVVPSCFTVRVSISLAACFISVLTVIFIVKTCGLNKTSAPHESIQTELGKREKIPASRTTTERQSMTEGTNREKLMGEGNEKADGLDETDTDLKGGLLGAHLDQVIRNLEDQKTALEKQIDKLKSGQLEVQKQIWESEKKLENPASFDRERKRQKREAAKKELEKRKQEHDELLQTMETLLETTKEVITNMKQIKEKLEKDK
ncbi:butyrophilin subfamily 3 member A2-like [Epinephelus lanceolatus]